MNEIRTWWANWEDKPKSVMGWCILTSGNAILIYATLQVLVMVGHMTMALFK